MKITDIPIKGYESLHKDELIEIFSESKPKLNFPEQKKKKIREKLNELRDKFSKPKIKEIRGSLHKIENKKSLSTQKIKEIETMMILNTKEWEM